MPLKSLFKSVTAYLIDKLHIVQGCCSYISGTRSRTLAKSKLVYHATLHKALGLVLSAQTGNKTEPLFRRLSRFAYIPFCLWCLRPLHSGTPFGSLR